MKIHKIERQSHHTIGNWGFSAEYGITDSPDGNNLILEPRLSRLLYVLSLSANEIASRKELIENVWTDAVVNDESLTRAVADLRKILSSNYGKAIEIETIPRRGYRLVLQTEPRLIALKLRISHPKRYVIFAIVFFLLALFWLLT